MEDRPFVLVVGGANLDIQARSRQGFLMGDSNPGTVWTSQGGVGRNMAESLARLGARVELVAPLGDDEAADEISRGCGALGIGTDFSPRYRGARSGRYVCLLDVDGRLAGAVADMAVMDLLGPAELGALSGLIDRVDLVLADANLRPDTLERLFDLAAGPRRPVYLDPVSTAKAARVAHLARRAALVKPNMAEAAILSGLPVRDEREAAAAARELRRRGSGEIVVSLGAAGLLYLGETGGGIARLGGSGAARNVSGAGDAALAALARFARSGRSLSERAALALAAATLVAASPDPVACTLDAESTIALAQGVRHEPLP